MTTQVIIFLFVVLAVGGLLIWASIENNKEIKQQKESRERDVR